MIPFHSLTFAFPQSLCIFLSHLSLYLLLPLSPSLNETFRVNILFVYLYNCSPYTLSLSFVSFLCLLLATNFHHPKVEKGENLWKCRLLVFPCLSMRRTAQTKLRLFEIYSITVLIVWPIMVNCQLLFRFIYYNNLLIMSTISKGFPISHFLCFKTTWL